MTATIPNDQQLAMMKDSAEAITAALGKIPEILVVAGSGLGSFAGTLKDAKAISYEEITHFPASTVVGHAGKLVKGKCGGAEIMVMSGRKHLYEGVDATVAVYPLRTLLRAGVKTVILSNAAGGLNVKFEVGDLMLITDQINFQWKNPLIGPNMDEIGPRFPDMSEPYSRALQEVARKAALAEGIALREGVYLAGTGPSYETQAEVGMLRQWADVVGMSTVPETLVAIHAGAKVLGITLVSNSLVHRTDVVTTHEEVMEAGKASAEKFNRLVAAVIADITSTGSSSN